MHRRQHDAQLVALEHHRDARRAGEVREQIRVPLPRQSCQRERCFIDGRGCDGGDVSALRVRGRLDDRVVRGPARLRRHRARTKRPQRGAVVRSVEHRLADFADRRIRCGLHRDLGSDPGRIADRDADPRFSH